MSDRAGTGSALGYAEVLLAAALWGSSGIFATQLFRGGMSAESVALLRPLVGLSFIGLGTLLWKREELRVARRALWVLTGLGGVATATFQLAYQMSTASVGVPATVALIYLAPAMVTAASGPLLGEWPTRERVAFTLLSVVGVWLAALNAQGSDVPLTPGGASWGVLAATSYSAYTLFGRYAAPRWGSFATVLYSTLGACVLLAAALPAMGLHVALPESAPAWALLVLFGFLTIALATLLFYDALGRVEAGPASVASTVEPVVAALLATWLLGQGLGVWGWVGMALVVTGVAGAYRSGIRPRVGRA